ncbi:MAG TPA: hypothetical protein DCQ29_01475 [Chitinophagaceae bacterium]|nr:hypothetical protein [Chitinophagaceae bacterium]
MRYRYLIFFLLILVGFDSTAQDTLPKFTARNLGNNRMQISWVNPHKNVIQLNIQRSFDSLRYFRTIYTAPSPQLPTNGFTDKAPIEKVYYRIFYVLEGGAYFFTQSKLARDIVPANTNVQLNANEQEEYKRLQIGKDRLIVTDKKDKTAGSKKDAMGGGSQIVVEEPVITIRTPDSTIGTFRGEAYKRFRDSILLKTKDTLLTVHFDELLLKRYKPVEVFRPSPYFYTQKNGVAILKLPQASHHKTYRLKVMNEQRIKVFELGDIQEPELFIEKSNFLKSGWFLFELYENNVLKEKNKIYISKDF